MQTDNQKLERLFQIVQGSFAFYLNLDNEEVKLESKLQTDLRIDEIELFEIAMDLEDQLDMEILGEFLAPFQDGDKQDATVGEFVSTFFETYKSRF